ncbi:fatty acid desaturase [Sulfitobacter sp. D35]|uniref:fatty acid desaturase n=1 Tax=Sulfitobacter sp. D35 TaxID=3083252 RepID=UPI00296FCFA8|nr:fatty acid desaturase [Sulfitobacter sp. D35]MDW4497597.1 fatty acid desaturase [Sulfitobacter sp. D35]
MDHAAFLKSLDAGTRDRLTRRSTAKGLTHLAGHLGAILLTGTWIALQGPFWGLVLLPHGVLLVFLFTLSHECTHQTPFASARLCDIVGHAIAPVLALPFTWFRYFHLAHHRFTNDPAYDPEIMDHGRPETWRAYLVYLVGWGYWSGNLATLWRNAIGRIGADYLPVRKHGAIRREARTILALYALAALSLAFTPLLLWIWLVPVLLGQPFLRLYLLAEHGHCPPVANMLENTRTTLTSRAVRFLAWNMPYHAEHHAFPAVPFHALPALHEMARAHLKSVSPGYVAFTRAYVRDLDG